MTVCTQLLLDVMQFCTCLRNYLMTRFISDEVHRQRLARMANAATLRKEVEQENKRRQYEAKFLQSASYAKASMNLCPLFRVMQASLCLFITPSVDLKTQFQKDTREVKVQNFMNSIAYSAQMVYADPPGKPAVPIIALQNVIIAFCLLLLACRQHHQGRQ